MKILSLCKLWNRKLILPTNCKVLTIYIDKFLKTVGWILWIVDQRYYLLDLAKYVDMVHLSSDSKFSRTSYLAYASKWNS